jgi:adenosylcobinamide-phosphate synthase
MSTVGAMLFGMGLDALLGEPRRMHPLVGFGRMAQAIERGLHRDTRTRGVIAWCAAVLPAVAVVAVVGHVLARWSPWAAAAFSAAVLCLAIGHRSLGEHARAVEMPLRAGDLDTARAMVGRMVSRDTQALDASQVAAAATESVLENGADAVFGALFWFAVLGAPGVVLYRLANTLDAMWGYRTARHERFGWAAARIDDILNYIPARLTALTYAVLGDMRRALRCWRTQAPQWDSPNAGPVMAAGAGAIRVSLGGPAPYHGVWEDRPTLGEGDAPNADAIAAALRLVRHGVWLWLCIVVIAAFVAWRIGGGLHVWTSHA